MKILRRNLSLMLAVRYLNPLRTMFSIITLICLGGVALGVMVLIVVLSVMEGLQKEMEDRVLAFTPHYLLAQTTDGASRSTLRQEQADWEQVIDNLQQLPGITSAYPQLESEAFAQSQYGRLTVHFNAIQPHNSGQLAPLLPMLKSGSFDFGEGLDQECVISMRTAQALGLEIGDTLHLTPVGSIDEIANIYAMIQEPLQTQTNEAFTHSISSFFDNAQLTRDGESVAPEKISEVLEQISAMPGNKLRKSEKEACATLYNMAAEHFNALPFTQEEKQLWQDTVTKLATLDRDREDGKEVKSINEMVMPVDLRVIGIYQAPENMDGPNIYMPLAIAQEVMGYSNSSANQVMGICVRLSDPHNPGNIEQKIEALLPNLPATENYPQAFWRISPWTKNFEQWYQLIANERVMMSFVLTIITLIASFCIMAVMFTVSIQRKREIAVLQALGATPGKIMGIFAWQGVIIGFMGAILGIILALVVLHYRLEIQTALATIGLDPFPMEAHGITLPAAFEPATFAWQAIKAFIMVTIASVIPAFLVSRQDPAKALRSN